ncbi:hypothetical protein [Arthrobacter wenxiniae]|jgi:hypothetical protein|uniref:Uncharacterized protein n=1 Tax=Arthrobacter wenxiniae TaxID=2713570 RepID=A0A7Y7IJ65_9MICC|nr:hypothetical protein [Arthrobacter wenxiniae]NVM96237.1 hypothetical protein [Arthrobacter wenxiniae]
MSIWPVLLERLEADVALACVLARAEPAGLQHDTASWVPSADPGPLPVELAARARRLAAAQAEAAQLLGAAVRETAELLARAQPVRAQPRSVYVDVTG